MTDELVDGPLPLQHLRGALGRCGRHQAPRVVDLTNTLDRTGTMP